MLKMIASHSVLGAVDLFKSIQSSGKILSNNLYIIAPIIFLVSLAMGGIAFAFGRKGAENGKSHIWSVLMGVFFFLAAASFVTTMFSMFGSTAQGI